MTVSPDEGVDSHDETILNTPPVSSDSAVTEVSQDTQADGVGLGYPVSSESEEARELVVQEPEVVVSVRRGSDDLSLASASTFGGVDQHGRTRVTPGRWLARGLIVVVLIVAVVVSILGLRFYHDASGSSGGKEVTVFVRPGSTLSDLANVLASRAVVGSAFDFKLYLHLHHAPILEPGIYYLVTHEAFSKIIASVAQGPVSVRLTVLPGSTLTTIAAQVARLHGHSAQAFLAAAQPSAFYSPYFVNARPRNLEGLLYPDTYFIDPLESDHQIIKTMLDRLAQIASSLGLHPTGSYHGLSPYQILIGASIVQREANLPSDMAKVARVILNRLAAGMPLQMDSTVRYATGNYGGPITTTQLGSTSPYNTYVHLGLPP
ncbi:MAG: endolytic transglycosylase MltG, partial [Acidimicrobiales bacterium]